ncbi:hypothetical protein [Magnetococcus sp. PR-3]|uniref:hypothetical protein n=1 Tax=Magnetococcus sp. PR-3 TaxID=3120355 RepID=UPI002FCE31B2
MKMKQLADSVEPARHYPNQRRGERRQGQCRRIGMIQWLFGVGYTNDQATRGRGRRIKERRQVNMQFAYQSSSI